MDLVEGYGKLFLNHKTTNPNHQLKEADSFGAVAKQNHKDGCKPWKIAGTSGLSPHKKKTGWSKGRTAIRSEESVLPDCQISGG